jgi:hypothetical protein
MHTISHVVYEVSHPENIHEQCVKKNVWTSRGGVGEYQKIEKTVWSSNEHLLMKDCAPRTQ